MHLDPVALGVVEGPMREGGEIEIRAELPIGAGEDVEVERGRHPRGIIVGRLEDAAVLDEVDADDEDGPRAEKPPGEVQERPCGFGLEIADRRAREEARERMPGEAARQHEALREIRGDRNDAEVRKLVAEPCRLVVQELGRDVDGNVGGQARQLVEQQAHLGAGTAAELDERARRSG